jgi:PAS domain S-box-containing protein
MGDTMPEKSNPLPRMESALRGEKRICSIRVLIYLVFIAYFGIFHIWLKNTSVFVLAPIFLVATGWLLFNVVLRLAFFLYRYSHWMSVASALVDVSTVTGLVFASQYVCALNYSDNLVFSLYFIAIALAAVRKNVWMVYTVGLSSAISYLLLSYYFQQTLHETSCDALYMGARRVGEIAWLNQLAKSLALAVVAWTVGYVTSRIRAARKNYATLFNNVPDGIVLTGTAGKIETVNQSFADMLQQRIPDIIDRSISGIFEYEYRANADNRIVTQRTAETKIPVSITESLLESDKPIPEKILSVRNMSEQEGLREQIFLAQKTEALGQIARGMAHDFNNLLGGILGAVSLIRNRLCRAPESIEYTKLRRHAKVIQECAENARDILKSLLALSRAQGRSTSSFEIRKLLNELQHFTRKTFGEMHRIKLTLSLDTPILIEGDEANIFQALLNICLNAREAMSDGGEITIQAQTPPASELVELPPYMRLATDMADVRFLTITISDHGHGMEPRVLRRCMEPFFSTKETTRRGTGLGLSIAHTIIRHHNGSMNITSSKDRGTSVSVYLPFSNSKERPL